MSSISPWILGSDIFGRKVLSAELQTTFPGSPGADDNASAVAGLLALGRLLRKIPKRKNTELSVSWDGVDLP